MDSFETTNQKSLCHKNIVLSTLTAAAFELPDWLNGWTCIWSVHPDLSVIFSTYECKACTLTPTQSLLHIYEVVMEQSNIEALALHNRNRWQTSKDSWYNRAITNVNHFIEVSKLQQLWQYKTDLQTFGKGKGTMLPIWFNLFDQIICQMNNFEIFMTTNFYLLKQKEKYSKLFHYT